MTGTVEQLCLATLGFVRAFLTWFSTAAFGPSVDAAFTLSPTFTGTAGFLP